jgi:hypothetical protein
VREWSHGAQGGFGSILALIDSFLLERRPSSAPRAAREGDWLQASIRVGLQSPSPKAPREERIHQLSTRGASALHLACQNGPTEPNNTVGPWCLHQRETLWTD